ncbi:serine/threonine-protein kinase STY46-like isoform X7 [Quercus robur]|uniref:serine/threonine-protein kinase STY46-like isoform X7 n=1 Tax=Quercus robur TaxID=38942 RepID=UPI00216296AE|nr:serine/threonine-protein kinase STY46-like isoform X7 [Quercus robur]
MEDTESSSRVLDFTRTQNQSQIQSRFSREQRQKIDVYNEVLHRLKHLNVAESNLPGFEDELWAHFHGLPVRYAVDMNAERAQDVLMHKRLLKMARNPSIRHAIDVRLVQVHSTSGGNCSSSRHSNFQREVDAQCSDYLSKHSVHPPPAFGPSPDVELTLEVNQLHVQDRHDNVNDNRLYSRATYEITISTYDKPKIFNQLSSLLSEIGLNIQEAHAFSTIDGFFLDVFLVDSLAHEETEQLKNKLLKKIPRIEKQPLLTCDSVPSAGKQNQSGIKFISNYVNLPSNGIDVREIDPSSLIYEKKIVSVSFCDLYKGTFCYQDVAIKVLRAEHMNENMQREFTQEVIMMREIQHKNVVQFIGACTRPPSLCIVMEYMSGGSIHDFLHKQKNVFTHPDLIRVAIDVSKGMKYLHHNNIIHRDLKAANLLMDGNGVVKISDFGIARMQAQSGVMTAETGTYRWMAPEVIEHKPYDHKVDVFSFGVLLWELLTGKLPYEQLSPLQAAVGVVQKGLRPIIPKQTPQKLGELLERCWQQDPSSRPEFSEILEILQHMAKRVAAEGMDRQKGKSPRRVSAFVRSVD